MRAKKTLKAVIKDIIEKIAVVLEGLRGEECIATLNLESLDTN